MDLNHKFACRLYQSTATVLKCKARNYISENLCSGCHKCICTADAKWDCEELRKCENTEEDLKEIGDEDIDKALDFIHEKLKQEERTAKARSNELLVPGLSNDDILLEEREVKMEDDILELMRLKRSASDKNIDKNKDKHNDTIKFYHTLGEINEDMLKHENFSGTILAHKIETAPYVSRRTSSVNNSSNLQIEQMHPKDYHHDDNNVDTPTIHDDQEDLHAHGIHRLKGNHTQEKRDKEISKLVVNELKGGVSEAIGDSRVPVISNITFTPENDTLTAMAFIAGNLLNKLWNLEKDGIDDVTNSETLKQQKLADLLELFKEPLNIRQELFLKNALEQLSIAIGQNKNVENISLCKNVEEILKPDTNKDINKEKNVYNEQTTGISNKATAEAFHKISDVLNLIKKYDRVQNSLVNVQRVNSSDIRRLESEITGSVLTRDEKSALDVYGKTLETITNLLIPGKKSTKVLDTVRYSNLFAADSVIKKKLIEMNVPNLNITAKDKIVFDYLNHIKNSPNCLLKMQQQKISLPQIEGNILLNLSEFFKIKSLSDLIKLVEPENKRVLRSQVTTTNKPKQVIKQTPDIKKKNDDVKNLQATKEKLKGHLKSIIEDLMELQQNSGKNTKDADIKVMEALPCIYNLLNAGKNELNKFSSHTTNSKTTTDKNATSKIQTIFNNLKQELKSTQTRRNTKLGGSRPKSAIVWERIIKDARSKKKNLRRTISEVPKSVESLKLIMDHVGSSGSNTYKSYAILHEVPSVEKLVLLKTFKADTDKYIKTLEQILLSLQFSSSWSEGDLKEFNEFIENAAISVNLNKKVVEKLDKQKMIHNSPSIVPKRNSKTRFEINEPMHTKVVSYPSKVTREQITRQFMKNRLLLYVQTKEAKGESQNNINYDIAKKALLHLELGNEQIAMELFEILIKNSKHKETKKANPQITDFSREQRQLTRRRPQVEPLIKFIEPKALKQEQVTNQDNFIKRLLSFKNMF